MDEVHTTGRACELVKGIENIYIEFTESVQDVRKKQGGKLGSSVANWLTGGRVKTAKDLLCDKFITDIDSQLKLLDECLEDADENEITQACDMLADVLSEPRPADSNSTTDLMKRAMFGKLKPYLPGVSQEKLISIKQKTEAAYKKFQRLPVEKDMLKEIDRYIKGSPSVK